MTHSPPDPPAGAGRDDAREGGEPAGGRDPAPDLRDPDLPDPELPDPRPPAPPGAPSSAEPWARAARSVAVVAVLVAGALFAFHSVLRLPGDAVDKGREVVRDLERVAAAFRRGTVETRFATYATRVVGTSYLQFATLEQSESWRRTDSATVLWGHLALPDLVVEASAPVSTTYYLDLDEPWSFTLEGSRLLVEAPPIRFNRPAIDASEITYTVTRGSLLRDEEEALERLKTSLTALARLRAREQIPLVREIGRREAERFVETWLLEAFADGEQYDVAVRFPGEAEPGERTAPDVEGR